MTTDYREWVPPAHLAAIVECFWSRTTDAAAGGHRVLPDGCVDVIFERGVQARAYVVGAMTAPIFVEARDVEVFGVRLRPGRARSLLRADAIALTDARVPLDAVRTDAARVAHGLWDAAQDARVSHISERLGHLVEGVATDQRVLYALERLVADGSATTDAICSELGITRQSLARAFRKHVGLSPKMFQRVMRAQRALTALRRGELQLARIAVACGYYDQAHLSADVRALTWSTPSALRRGL
jgi:AraC-like DNA-binding protein